MIVLGSSSDFGDYKLEVKCTVPAETEVVCGSRVSGSAGGPPSVVGNFSRAVRYEFCPENLGEARFSTCGSTFDTRLQVRGPGIDSVCTDCGNCVNEASLNFTAGCYDILVDGLNNAQGDYVLSVNCRTGPVGCGSRVTGLLSENSSTQVLFCPSTAGSAGINTCESAFSPTLRIQGLGVNLTCVNCPCGLKSLTFDVVQGECYEILVLGPDSNRRSYSLSIECVAPLPIQCGAQESGSTMDLPSVIGNPSGDALYLFCPSISGSAEISACGSSFNTLLHIQGPAVDFYCDSCAECGQEPAKFAFTDGACYRIFVDSPVPYYQYYGGYGQIGYGGYGYGEIGYGYGGYGNGNGVHDNYVLSISCKRPALRVQMDCGRSETGSTVGLPQAIGNPAGDAPFLFCPNQTALAKISTCGSNFNTWLHVRGPDIDVSCDDCGSCGLQAEVEILTMAGACYEIFVDGFGNSEGNFTVSISCNASQADFTCPTYLLGVDLMPELRPFSGPVTVWGEDRDMERAFQDGLLVTGKVSQVILTPELDFGDWSPALVENLNRSIRENGTHLVVHQQLQVLRALTQRDLELSGSFFCRSPQLQQLTGGFAHGPDSLSRRGRCVRRESLPETVDGFYGSYDSIAWTTPYGKGRITYFGFPYSPEGPDFRKLLESSISENCRAVGTGSAVSFPPNASNDTAPPLVCGGIVTGVVEEGSTAADSYLARHTFCTPAQTGDVGEILFSTCGSSFDAGLSISGARVSDACTGCGRCNSQTELKLRDLEADTCYEVVVYGSRSAVGNYSLWASCCLSEGSCNGKGRARHKWGSWSQPPSSEAEFCQCLCNYPSSGKTCDECNRFSLTVPVNGTCQDCFRPRPRARQTLVALHNTGLTWSPEVLLPECATSLTYSFRLSSGRVADVEIQPSQSSTPPTFAVLMNSCTRLELFGFGESRSTLSVALNVNGFPQAEVICAREMKCDFDAALLASANSRLHLAFHFAQYEAIVRYTIRLFREV